MMKSWTKILPLVFIEWWSKKNLERMYLQGKNYKYIVVQPFEGIYIKVN